MPTSRHTSDKNTFVVVQALHPDAVCQNSATGKRASGVHRDNTYTFTLLSIGLGQLIDQRTLAATWSTCDSDHHSSASFRKYSLQDFLSLMTAALDDTQGTSHRAGIRLQNSVD